jgi:hypothetical protein
VDFVAVTATIGDATKCETDSGKQTELKDAHLKTNSGNAVNHLTHGCSTVGGRQRVECETKVRPSQATEAEWRKNTLNKKKCGPIIFNAYNR